MSRIIVDSIRNSSASSDGITLSSDGKVTFPNTNTGKILQVQHTVKTDKFSTSSSSYTDVTGMSVTITPTNSSSKILLFSNIRFGAAAGNSDNKYQILRGSTVISTENYCRQPSTAESWIYADMILDSPNTTSATTYKIQCLCESSGIYVNRDSIDRSQGDSYLTAMEIPA